MPASTGQTREIGKEIEVKKSVPRSNANVAGDLRLEISMNSKKRKAPQDKIVQFDSSKVESPFLDARIIERKMGREKRKAVTG